MDEFRLMQLMSGMFGGGGGIDVAAVLLFVVVAVLFFLAPVLGYRSDRRGGLAASLYVLVGYGGVSVMQLFLQYMQILERNPRGGGGGGFDQAGFHVMFIFAILKLALFVVAMVTCAVGLQSLRLPPPEREDD
jgi:hypothetical protein